MSGPKGGDSRILIRVSYLPEEEPTPLVPHTQKQSSPPLSNGLAHIDQTTQSPSGVPLSAETPNLGMHVRGTQNPSQGTPTVRSLLAEEDARACTHSVGGAKEDVRVQIQSYVSALAATPGVRGDQDLRTHAPAYGSVLSGASGVKGVREQLVFSPQVIATMAASGRGFSGEGEKVSVHTGKLMMRSVTGRGQQLICDRATTQVSR